MDIYKILEKDHHSVKTLLRALVALEDDEIHGRHKLIEKITDELIPHARAEEAVFYNNLRRVEASKELSYHGYGEHLEIEALLRSLQVMDLIGSGWKNLAYKLKEAVEHHIKEEESELFAAGRQLFTDQEAEAMGYAFEQMKSDIKDGNFVASTGALGMNLLPPEITDALEKSGGR